MSNVDTEIVQKIGLPQKELSKFIGVSQQAFGQGIKLERRYLDDARLISIYKGLMDTGHSDKVNVLYQFAEDKTTFENEIREIEKHHGALGAVAGELKNDYLWIVRQRDRINEEWPFIDAFLDGEGLLSLVIATKSHKIAANSDWMAIRTFFETHYLKGMGNDKSYMERSRVIELIQTDVGLFVPEMLLPSVPDYNGEIGFVHSKHGFVELPKQMVSDLSFSVFMDFVTRTTGKDGVTLIGGEDVEIVWTSSSMPYLKALTLLIESGKSNITDGVANRLWELLRNPGLYSGYRVDWQKMAKALGIAGLNNLPVDYQQDKRIEVGQALTLIAEAATTV